MFPVGEARTLVENTVFDGRLALSAASLPEGTFVVAWTALNLCDVMWQVVDGSLSPLGVFNNLQIRSTDIVDTIDAVASSAGFTLAIESTLSSSRAISGAITSISIGSSGTLLGRSELGQRTWACAERDRSFGWHRWAHLDRVRKVRCRGNGAARSSCALIDPAPEIAQDLVRTPDVHAMKLCELGTAGRFHSERRSAKLCQEKRRAQYGVVVRRLRTPGRPP